MKIIQITNDLEKGDEIEIDIDEIKSLEDERLFQYPLTIITLRNGDSITAKGSLSDFLVG